MVNLSLSLNTRLGLKFDFLRFWRFFLGKCGTTSNRVTLVSGSDFGVLTCSCQCSVSNLPRELSRLHYLVLPSKLPETCFIR